MTKRISFFAFLLLLTVLRAEDHRAMPTPPADPQVVALPASCSLVESFTYKGVAKEKNKGKSALQQFQSQFPRLKQVEIVRTGQTQKEVQRFADGSAVETWKSGQVSFIVNSSTPDQITVSAPGMTPAGPAGVNGESDFSELAWINRDSFHGAMDRDGVKCFVYKAGDQTAWIEQVTRLPVHFRSSKMEISYQFKAPPDQPLQLPEKLSKKLEATKRAWMGRAN